MMKTPSWNLKHRAIYNDVYDKRRDERPVVSIAQLQKAHIDGNSLIFESDSQRARALGDGIFLLKIPEDFPITVCDIFARNFYQESGDHPYSGFKNMTAEQFGDPLLGFHTRINQIEQFLLERRFWKSHFPPTIEQAGSALTALSRTLLRALLPLTEIPQEHWSQATGGCSSSKGSYHLTFNHYRPSVDGVGLASHKDDGFLTILHTRSQGLEVNIHDRWEHIDPPQNYFVINFGLSMEILTRDSAKPIRAILHRVAQQSMDRTSFGHFTSSHCKPGKDAGIYSYSLSKGLHKVCSSRTLINANDEEIYLGTLPTKGRGKS